MNRQRAKIVIVDDNKAFLKMIFEHLNTKDKYTVICLEGLRNISELFVLNPSLVVLDLHMPILSGDQIFEQMQGISDLKNIPVILITALKQQASQATLNRVKIVLEKPFSLVELDDAIYSLLD